MGSGGSGQGRAERGDEEGGLEEGGVGNRVEWKWTGKERKEGDEVETKITLMKCPSSAKYQSLILYEGVLGHELH